MKLKLVLLTFLTFIFLFTPSFAQEYGVSISVTPKSTSIPPCEIATFNILVKNVGNKTDNYTLTVSGIPKDWYSLSEESFTLEAGASEEIYLFITPYCYGKPGTYNGSVTVSNKANATDYFTLTVIPDHKISTSMPEEVKVCLKEGLNFSAVVKNKGNYSESIILSASGNASDFVSLSEENFTLEPKEEKNVTITAMPVDVEAGVYELVLDASSTTSYATSKASSLIRVIECYKVGIQYPEKVEACINETTPFNFTVKNTGIKEDSYEISIEELNYTQMIKLKPGESKVFKSSFIRNETGTYKVNLMVKSNFTEAKGEITFDVVKCYGVDISVKEKEIEVEESRGRLVKAEITNLGTKADTFDILSSVNWASIKPSSVSLAPNESEIVYAYYSPPFGKIGTFNVSLTARSSKSTDSEILTIKVVKKIPTNVTTTITPTTLPINLTTTANLTTPPTTVNLTIPTGWTIQTLWENKIIASIIVAVIIVIVILIILYLIVMR